MTHIFYKFGEFEHLESLKKGELYCNPLHYFYNIEKDSERQDNHEGNMIITKPCLSTDMQITISHPLLGEYEIPNEDCLSLEFGTGNNPSHIFCFSLLEIEQMDQQYKIENLFKSSAIALFQPSLIKYITDSLKKKRIKHKVEKIRYENYDDQIIYEKGWDTKHIRYKNQKEIRIAIFNQEVINPFIHKFTHDAPIEIIPVDCNDSYICMSKPT